MKQGIFKIAQHTKLTENVFKMKLTGDTSEITSPGQFINIKLDGFFLRTLFRYMIRTKKA